MKFLDQAKIFITSGKGGDGCVSFRHEKYIEYGGPDGGNGGKGSNIIVETNKNLNTLIDFRYQQHIKGKNGKPGKGNNKTGANAKDILIKVPPGTQILSEDKSELIIDMIEDKKRFIIAEGGKGGIGNNHFKSSTNRAPRQFTEGDLGIEKWIWLSLKIFADVGIIGLPNAGKSTLLSKISSANPKIADYPFTTLHPVLGVIKNENFDFILADIPGIIKGAHEGRGLGDRFLAHIERCKILLHIIDSSSNNLVDKYNTVRNELKKYDSDLINKKEIIALNKFDICNRQKNDLQRELSEYTGKNIIVISSIKRVGLKELILNLTKELNINENEII